ncbi:hypothetical protein GEMRC1_012686 [Eukaryota sp. GEM-RC1]
MSHYLVLVNSKFSSEFFADVTLCKSVVSSGFPHLLHILMSISQHNSAIFSFEILELSLQLFTVLPRYLPSSFEFSGLCVSVLSKTPADILNQLFNDKSQQNSAESLSIIQLIISNLSANDVKLMESSLLLINYFSSSCVQLVTSPDLINCLCHITADTVHKLVAQQGTSIELFVDDLINSVFAEIQGTETVHCLDLLPVMLNSLLNICNSSAESLNSVVSNRNVRNIFSDLKFLSLGGNLTEFIEFLTSFLVSSSSCSVFWYTVMPNVFTFLYNALAGNVSCALSCVKQFVDCNFGHALIFSSIPQLLLKNLFVEYSNHEFDDVITCADILISLTDTNSPKIFKFLQESDVDNLILATTQSFPEMSPVLISKFLVLFQNCSKHFPSLFQSDELHTTLFELIRKYSIPKDTFAHCFDCLAELAIISSDILTFLSEFRRIEFLCQFSESKDCYLWS